MPRVLLTLLLIVLAAPAWAQPNRLDVVTRVAEADPARFACAHTDRPCAYDYIEALVCELRKDDARWAMNGRRGDPARPSWDAINYCGTGPATDPTGACRERLTIVDVIVGAGGDNPRPTWQAFVNDTTAGAWLVPDCDDAGGGGGGGGGGGTPGGTDYAAQLARIEQQVTGIADLLMGRYAALLEQAAAKSQDAAERAGAIQAQIAALPSTPMACLVGAVSLPGWAGGQRTVRLCPEGP